MQCFADNPPNAEMHLQDYSFVSCSLAVYQEDGGGGGSDEVSTRSGSDSVNGSNDVDADFDDDNSCSWSEEYTLSSYAGTSVSSDSGEGGSGDDDGRSSSSDNDPAKNKATRAGGGGGSGNDRNKWLKSLWTIVDRMDDRIGRKGAGGKRSPQPVKTILRPPTTYKYVVGMSGFPSKVAVYPKRM